MTLILLQPTSLPPTQMNVQPFILIETSTSSQSVSHPVQSPLLHVYSNKAKFGETHRHQDSRFVCLRSHWTIRSLRAVFLPWQNANKSRRLKPPRASLRFGGPEAYNYAIVKRINLQIVCACLKLQSCTFCFMWECVFGHQIRIASVASSKPNAITLQTI